MINLRQFTEHVGDAVVHEIYKKASKLYTKKSVQINSTFIGGGVAEMMNSLIPLMNDAGVTTGWRILKGIPDFFTVTKKFHNALQGDRINLTDRKKKLYLQVNERFAQMTHIYHDFVEIHDPQPLPLINFYKKCQPWIWRCHIDFSHPNPELWTFLKKYVLKYDVVIVSHEDYKKDDLPVEQRVIAPAIDPLSVKNKNLSDEDVNKYLKKFNIPTNKPIITQISRFDKWKDPGGVIDVFKIIKQKVDCRLILCGNMASDDPEGMKIYEMIRRKAGAMLETKDIILITLESNILVNILQRVSSVIIQKSIREGFGLTVTEALWKGTPVVASNKGGIPLQIQDGKSGYMLDPYDNEGFAERVMYLLDHPDKAKEFGKAGQEHVRKNFLITRLMKDYLDLMTELL